MRKNVFLATAVLIASALGGPASAQNVLQLRGTLDDPSTCVNQLAGETVDTGTFIGYNSPILDQPDYTIVVGDYLEYEVLIPAESTLTAGAVDMNLTATPRAAGGATLRDSYVTQDQNGLFAHPATDYRALSTRFNQVCGPDGQPQNVPLWQRGQWYTRRIDLSKLAIDADGNPIGIANIFLAVDEHDTTHLNDACPTDPNNPNAIALFRNINIKNRNAEGQEVVKLAIYNGEANLPVGGTSIEVATSQASDATVSVIEFQPVTNPPAENPPAAGS
jgi:hypothetical protein